MKRKILFFTAILALSLTVISACGGIDASASVKTITRPYIAQYECTDARYGETDLLEHFDYIKINFLNKDEFELIYKFKNGEKKIFEGNYTVDAETHELTGDIGVLGYKFKEKVKVENGKFTVKKTMGGKELFVKFEVK